MPTIRLLHLRTNEGRQSTPHNSFTFVNIKVTQIRSQLNTMNLKISKNDNC